MKSRAEPKRHSVSDQARSRLLMMDQLGRGAPLARDGGEPPGLIRRATQSCILYGPLHEVLH